MGNAQLYKPSSATGLVDEDSTIAVLVRRDIRRQIKTGAPAVGSNAKYNQLLRMKKSLAIRRSTPGRDWFYNTANIDDYYTWYRGGLSGLPSRFMVSQVKERQRGRGKSNDSHFWKRSRLHRSLSPRLPFWLHRWSKIRHGHAPNAEKTPTRCYLVCLKGNCIRRPWVPTGCVHVRDSW